MCRPRDVVPGQRARCWLSAFSFVRVGKPAGPGQLINTALRWLRREVDTVARPDGRLAGDIHVVGLEAVRRWWWWCESCRYRDVALVELESSSLAKAQNVSHHVAVLGSDWLKSGRL